MDFYSKTNLNGKTAVISGAARNIGKAFAEALASVGANVCLVDTDQINVYNTTQQIACKYNVRTSSYAVVQADAPTLDIKSANSFSLYIIL